MILFLENPGMSIGKNSELIEVKEHGKSVIKLSIRELEAIIIYSNINITPEATSLLMQYSIPVFYQKGSQVVAYLTPFFNHGFVLIRELQFLSRNTIKGVKLLCSFVKGALLNKRQLLLYLAKSKNRTDSSISKELRESADNIDKIIKDIDENYYINKFKINVLSKFNTQNGSNSEIIETLYNEPMHIDSLSDIRIELLNKEAIGTKEYFEGIRKIIPNEFGFEARTRRPPLDPISAMLSYGYTILEGFIITAISVCGLEPYCGFLHTDRSGKTSLVYDLMEEFRQPIVDRIVLKMINKKMIKSDDFCKDNAFIKLNDNVRVKYVDLLFSEIKDSIRLFDNKKMSFRQGMIYQARKLCRFFLGKEENYYPYVFDF